MQFECPACLEENEIEIEDLPDRACDDMDFECAHCTTIVQIGWVAEVEVRSVTCELGDLDESLAS